MSQEIIHTAKFKEAFGRLCQESVDKIFILTDETTPPVVCLEDAQSAMRWTRAHAETLGIDPGRSGHDQR